MFGTINHCFFSEFFRKKSEQFNLCSQIYDLPATNSTFSFQTNKRLISHEFIHTIIKHLTNCKELTIDFYGNPRIEDEDLPLEPVEFNNLKVLKLPCLNLTTFINCIDAKNLEVLHFDIEFRIGYNSEVCLEIFQFINSKNFEKLQKLEIKNCFRWTPKELQLNYMFSNTETCREMLKFLKIRLQNVEKLEICKGCLKQEFIDRLVKLSHKTLVEVDIDIATNILQAELIFKNAHKLTIRRTQIKEALMIKLAAIFPEVITLAIKSSSFQLFHGHDFQRFFHETFHNLVVCDIEDIS